MTHSRYTIARSERTRVGVATLLVALMSITMLASAVVAQEESAAPLASPTAAEAACTSASDLQLIVDFVRDSVEAEAGLITVGIGVIAGVSEANTLAGLVAETYRPLVGDLILSLQGLRDTIGSLGELDTTGAKIATIGESVTEIGSAMDALTVQLRSSCGNA